MRLEELLENLLELDKVQFFRIDSLTNLKKIYTPSIINNQPI